MKKQITYRLPCRTRAEDCEAPPKKRELRKSLGAFLALVMLFMLAVPEAKAQSMTPLTASLNVDIEKGYIEVFNIDYHEDWGLNEYLLEGSHLEVSYGGKSIKVEFTSENSQPGDGATWMLRKENNQIGNVYASENGNWTKQLTAAYQGVYNSKAPNGNRTKGNIKWYLPKDCYGKMIHVKLFLRIKKNGTTNPFLMSSSFGGGSYLFTGSTTISGYKNVITKNATTRKYKNVFSFDAPGSFNEKYLSDANEYKQEEGTTRYFKEYPISDYTQKVTVKYAYPQSRDDDSKLPEGVKSVFNDEYTIPAYHQASDYKAEYSKATGKVTLSWVVNNANESNCINEGEFEIQASTDENFTSPRRVQLETFAVGKQNYLIEDDVAELSNYDKMYYRIRRTHTNDWDLCSTTSVAISLADHAKITTATATFDTNNSTAIIAWPNVTGYWSTNTKLVIEKRNAITGGVVETFELNKEEWKKGSYEDDAIVSCISYSYKLQIKPGNTIFATQKAITTQDEIIINDLGDLLSLKASKGCYSDRVNLQWSSKGKFDQYIIRRTHYAQKSDTLQIALMPASSLDLYTFDDDKCIAGIYYTYIIQGMIECGGKKILGKSILAEVGFRSPLGNIYGSVTYENGQSVAGVEIRIEQDGTNIVSGSSILFPGNAASSLSVKNMSEAISNNAFTFQTWIKPTDASPKDQVLFSASGQYEIGFDSNTELYLKQDNAELIKTPYKFDNSKFVHISVVRSADSVFVYAGDSVLSKVELAATSATSQKAFLLGSNGTSNAYKGHMDEVRIWNRALTYNEIEQDYKRLITGDEKNLIAYYRFDEVIDNAFYDMSYIPYSGNDAYNENHGEIKGNAKHNAVIPDNEQLGLKGITNESGIYFIKGVPYTGSGTQYKIIPRMGTHQFDPTHQTRFIGGGSLSHEANFKDKSSFPVSGHVYYSNTTVPVQGVMFKIDGLYANDGKGNVITTDDAGAFKISVPVGYHEVKAEKTNHKFEDHGRITDSEGKDLNYQKPIVGRVLHDATTIRFIGRIGGGAIQEAYPLGHSLSTNNLGDDATVEIELEKEGSFTDKAISNDHFKPKDADKRPNSSRWEGKKTIGSIRGNKISLNVDRTTGEFVVDLIPEKFKVIKVETQGHTGILKNPITIDLSEKLIEQEEVYAYKDSIEGRNGVEYFDYSDVVLFNDSYKFILRQTPTVEIKQLVGNKEVDYFGNDSISITNLLNEKTTMPVYDKHLKAYLFKDTPILTSGTAYGLKIRAFESYLYNNNNEINDKVPTADGVVKINNSWRDGAVGIDEISLDEKGEAYYRFITGAPEESGTAKTFGANVDFSGNSVSWNSGNNQKAYILGSSAATGDFVTDGPNKLLTVLRDPPGSKSYAYLQKGTTFTSNTKTTETFHNDGKIETTTKLGLEVKTVAGLGFGVITEAETTNEVKVGFSHNENREWGDITTRTTTISDQITTSDDPLYVGADGDLFIGNSTNISYGITNSILLIPINYKKDGDDVLAENGSTFLVKRKTLSTSTSFKTMFAYPQIHIESVLIPNLIEIRNSLFANEAPNKAIYESKLPITDPNYGASNNDKDAFKEEANPSQEVLLVGPSYTIKYPNNEIPKATPDSIHYYNEKIKNWKNLLYKNEEAKLTAIEKLNDQSNYSFHAGSKIEYSREYSFQKTDYYNFEYILSGEVAGQIGLALNGVGVIVGVSEEFGGGRIKETEDSKAKTRKEGFVLAEEGSDYLSVDVFFEENADYEDYLKNKDKDKDNDNEINKGEGKYLRKGPFVYRTKGGRTSCPYEGGYISKYYTPGAMISEPTLRIEVPRIRTDKNLVKNVPSNRKAVFKLFLENLSESGDDMYYTLNLLDKSNPNGATLSIDGLALGNNGRTILVPYGEVLQKTMEVARGPEEMNYNDLQLILASQCQYDPTNHQENIADTVFFSAHFIPSCSEIQMKAPLDKWITNTDSKFDISKNGYILPIVLDQFDLNNGSLERFEIQAKQEDESVWTTQRIFYLDPALAEGKSNAEVVDKDASEIKYNFVMNAMSDSRYDVRAVSICKVLNDEILTYSEIVSGTKDTQRPTLFGSVQPANGILNVDNEVLLNFNEIIKEGAFTRNDFTVTGIRNGSKTDHGVSVLFDGVDNYIASEAEKNLSDKNITIEMWVLKSASNAATLFSHGNVNESLEFGFDTDNQLEVRVGESVVKSSPLAIRDGEWAHVAMVYNTETQTASAYYNFSAVMINSIVAGYKGQGNWELGRSIKHGGQYFAGQMHEVRVWTKERSSGELQTNSMKSLTGSESGLLVYYPMSEGKGEVAFDKARGANGAIHGEWKTPEGKAIAFDGASNLKIASGSTIVVDSEMDYTLEFWFKADKGQTDVALITNELKQDIIESVKDRFFVGFNNSGKLIFRSNGNETIVERKDKQDYRNNVWHHFAASINRISRKIEIYVDEEMVSQLRTDNVGGISSDYIIVGAK